MGLQDILSPNGVILDLKASCKREVISELAKAAAKLIDADCESIRAALMEREQLGSTGVGDGVALPHGKIDNLSKLTGLLVRLDKPVDFDSVDDKPVDLVFLLLAPAEATAAHLKALAKVSRLMREEDVRAALRGAETAEALYAAAADNSARSNAA